MVGAALVPLRLLFPRVHGFAYAAGAPISLLGIALLQAALITLMGYSEGLHAEDLDLRAQAAILGKSVLWSTAVLCFAYGLQGAPWTTGGLFCITGVVDFGALWARRRWNEERTGDACGHSDLRNVLIVGAGRVGRRIALNVEKHPARGRNVCGFLDDESPIGDGVVGRVAGFGTNGPQTVCGRGDFGGSAESGCNALGSGGVHATASRCGDRS